jgi:hypothetical protein
LTYHWQINRRDRGFQVLFKNTAGKAHLSDRLLSINLDVQHSMMASVLPYDIVAQIIDNIGESDDIDLIKELALVSHSFRQICTKHLFATIDLMMKVQWYTHLQRRDSSSYLKEDRK